MRSLVVHAGNKPFIVFIILFSLGLFASTAQSDAEHDAFEKIVVFGDSLSDPGNAYFLLGEEASAPFELIPSAPYGIGGHRFTNGKTWVEQMAKKLKEKAKPAFKHMRHTNYAVGGARARDDGATGLTTQVNLFLARNSSQDIQDNLFVVFIGGNDIRDALEAFAQDTTGQSSFIILTAALTAIADNIAALISSGAREFLVVNAPDISLAPAIRLAGPQAQAGAKALSMQFNDGLNVLLTDLQTWLPVNIRRFDVFSLLNDVVQSPEDYDLTNVDMPCITPGVIEHAVCNKPKDYLFWDGVHPTKAGHAIIAKQALQLLNREGDDDDEHWERDEKMKKNKHRPVRLVYNQTH